jgi:hypothetical protein
MTQTALTGPGTPPVRVAGAVIGAACLLALGGGGLAVAGLASGERPVAAREAGAGRWTVATSYGPVSVERLERFRGGPHAGGGHGRAPAGADRIRVSLDLTNRGRRTLPFSPGQFRLRLGGSSATVPPTRPTPPPGSIAAGQTLRQRPTFVVPASQRSFALVFDDLNRPRPRSIELGPLIPRKG